MIHPCGPRLLVRPYKQVEVDEVLKAAQEFGFTIVNSNQKREDASVDKGVVLAIGPTAWNLPEHGGKPWCEVGDTVLFVKFAPKFVEDPETEETLAILNDDDVVAVVAKGNKE